MSTAVWDWLVWFSQRRRFADMPHRKASENPQASLTPDAMATPWSSGTFLHFLMDLSLAVGPWVNLSSRSPEKRPSVIQRGLMTTEIWVQWTKGFRGKTLCGGSITSVSLTTAKNAFIRGALLLWMRLWALLMHHEWCSPGIDAVLYCCTSHNQSVQMVTEIL